MRRGRIERKKSQCLQMGRRVVGVRREAERGGGFIDLLSVSSSEDRRQTEALVFIEVNAGTRALRLGGRGDGGGVWLGWARRGRSVCKKNSAIWLLRDLEKHTCHFLVSEGKEARSQKWQFSYKAEYSCSSINSNGGRLRPTIRTHLPWNHSCCSSRGKKPRRVLFFSRTKKMTISFTCRFVGTLSTTCEQTNKIKLKVMLNSPVLPQLLFLGIPATKVKASGECGANWSGGRSAFNINDERRAYICMF